MLRAVVDTNVLFTGLTKQGADASVVDAWVGRRFLPCVSTALALEYESVMLRKLGPSKQQTAMEALQALLARCHYTPIRFRYRPASRDPGDDHVVECVLNSQSMLVTRNVRDFQEPSRQLGFRVLQPPAFLELLRKEN